MMGAERIDFCGVGGFSVGNAQNFSAMTGVTALVFDGANVCGVDISGGGPAARENYLFSPLSYQQSVTALLLSGGSAYGLSAADGAMRFLEERGMGYRVGNLVVPIVPQSCIFDLGIGSSRIRPDADMGYAACESALNAYDEFHGPRSGSVGAGTGATVGKLFGMERAQKSGIGYCAFKCGAFKVGAVVAVNSLGDVYDWQSGKKIAGAMDEARRNFISTEDALCEAAGMSAPLPDGTNTTIGAVVMNGALSQQELCKVAAMTRGALARSINPVGTTADGDTMYAISTGTVRIDVNAAGVLACRAVSGAIIDAVKSSFLEDAEYLKAVNAAKEK